MIINNCANDFRVAMTGDCTMVKLWLLFLIFFTGKFAVVTCGTVRLTMVTPDPYPSDFNQPTLNCFPTSPTTLTFGRPFAIGLPGSTIQSSVTLPDKSTTSNNGQTVSLPSSVDSVGLFYCEGVSEGMTSRVYSVIHSPSRRFEPAGGLVTKTINKGEDATLSFVNYNNMGTAPLWRRVNSEGVTDLGSVDGQYTITVASADTKNGDLYTVIQSGLTLNDNHFAIIRLIVRGCSAGKWGRPSCTEVCDLCYNGGICDDSTGECICPPGFSGANCLNACGASQFGWYCELTCGQGNIVQSCTGSQFGLPDPYGSSCISGYTGRYCDSLCPTGKFGAGCTEDCHCSSLATCNIFNGRCPTNQCAAGWSGVNCQVPDVCPTGYYGRDCLSKCYCLGDTACDKYTGYCSGSGGLCAEGFNCVRVSCPSGYFNTSCDRSCHCFNDSACDGITGYCTASLGICAANFQSDTGTNNCLLGIVEFVALSKPNADQDVTYSCTGSSGNELMSSSITLFITDSAQSATSSVTNSTLSNGELTNIFTVSGLRNGDRVLCSLGSVEENVTSVLLTAEFYDPPNLNQRPQVTADSTSATVTWQAWQPGDLAGDGPVILYRVYHTLSSNISWVNSGVVPVSNQSETAYSFTVEPLQPETDYIFSVSAVRDGMGGEGRMITSDVIQTLATTVIRATTVEPPTGGNSTSPNIVVIVVPVVLVIVFLIVIVILTMVLLRRIRKNRLPTHTSGNGNSVHGKFESTYDMNSLHTIDNPMMVPIADNPSNGELAPEPDHGRPVSNASQGLVPTSPTSAFAGLPYLPSSYREFLRDPVPLKNFVKYVQTNLQNGRLKDEWASFPGMEAMCSCEVSQRVNNKAKNRYRNIPAYDHCRVVLELQDGNPDSDYINANYIKGYKNDKAYIATQGPTELTAPAFWRMVWQEKIQIIVMATNLIEDTKVKCFKYWPNKGEAQTLGGILVTILAEEDKGEYLVRTMTVTNKGNSETRKVVQFNYTSWPDKDVPKDVTPVLKFIQDFSDSDPGMYLIHCSAGAGRTGAIIAIHTSLQRARAENNIDVYNLVATMRNHRVSIVQTPTQYVFIHLALLEALFSNDTAIPKDSFTKRFAEMKKKKTFIEEFEQLGNITPIPGPEKCRNSMSALNENKNRLSQTIIAEHCRPYLVTPREDGTEYNYINASYLDGFKKPDSFIVTQMPLPNTVIDLWRLVFDYQITTIVMLNPMDSEDAESPQYWPDKGTEEYGPFAVTHINTASRNGYVVRVLQFTHQRQNRGRSVRHYQLTDWPASEAVPKSPDTLLRLILRVEADRQLEPESAQIHPIVVHCIDGLGRSGVFCTLKNSLERLYKVQSVDIMQTLKLLRLNRPFLLDNAKLYQLCYEGVLAYINNTDQYCKEAEEQIYMNVPSSEEEQPQNDPPKEMIYQNMDIVASSDT